MEKIIETTVLMFKKTYSGTKQLQAIPFNKKEYCDFRGWEVLENEDPTEEGYVVMYLDGGKPNLPNYSGYVSWSPKDVFEKAYQEVVPETFITRLIAEETQLNDSKAKLSSFIESGSFGKIAEEQQELLKEQLVAMTTYSEILNKRIIQINNLASL